MTTSNSNVDCLTKSAAHRLLAGEMSESEEADAQAHLVSCHRCRESLSELQAEHEAMIMQLRKLSTARPDRKGERHHQEIARQRRVYSGPAAESEAAPPLHIPGYQVLDEMHRGGQGVVYRAIQESTKRQVAIKVLLDGTLASTAARRRFEREIELAASLKHPHIVVVFDSGQTADRHQYCVMDLIEGVPLDAYVRKNQLKLKDILRLFDLVCGAVAHAHQRGVIHRDLKPSNILVENDGTPRILDFGLARLSSESPDSFLSVTGQVLGTLPYMSPEQAKGQTSAVDTRSDVYALGVILYELLTGNYPYPVVGALAEVLRNIAEVEPEQPSSWFKKTTRTSIDSPSTSHRVNHELETIILKALSKEPDRRYPSADSFREDIDRFLTGAAVLAKRDSAMYVLRKLATRHWYATAVLAVLVFTILGLSGISFDFYRQSRIAITQKETKAKLLFEQIEKLMELSKSTQIAVHRMSLGWFLFEWGTGRAQRASDIVHLMPTSLPERTVMEFLLDDRMSFEELKVELPASESALAHFAAGERELKAGRTAKARSHFEQASFKKNDWLRATVDSRLDELRRVSDVRETN